MAASFLDLAVSSYRLPRHDHVCIHSISTCLNACPSFPSPPRDAREARANPQRVGHAVACPLITCTHSAALHIKERPQHLHCPHRSSHKHTTFSTLARILQVVPSDMPSLKRPRAALAPHVGVPVDATLSPPILIPPSYCKAPPRKQRRLDDSRAPLSDMSNEPYTVTNLPSSRTPKRHANPPPNSPSPRPRGPVKAAPLVRMRSCEEDPNDGITALPAVPRRTLTPGYSLRSQNRHSSYIPSSESAPGPFHMLECMQSGGFATAWAARDLSTSRVLCFKVTSKKIVSEYKASRLALERELEAYQRLAACIETSYVMQLHGVFQDSSRVYFAMVSDYAPNWTPVVTISPRI